MAHLCCKNSKHFENPTRCIFRGSEGAGADLFSESSSSVKKVENWVDTKGESTAEAKALAESVSKQEEQIREGTRSDLLELYVNLFTGTGVIGFKETYNVPALTVGPEYDKNGLLQVLEKNSTELRLAFNATPDLRLLAYATIYNNFKKAGLDVNFLPKGAQVVLTNGMVTVTYLENGVQKTASSEIFPWSTAEVAQKKWLEIEAKKREAESHRLDIEGRPGMDLDGDGTIDTEAERPRGETPPPLPTAVEPPPLPIAPEGSEVVSEDAEYEKRLNAKVDAFKERHGLTEEGDRIGLHIQFGAATFVASLETPDGTRVSINVRAEESEPIAPDKLKAVLEQRLDEEIANWDRELAKEAPSELEKDWQRVMESAKKMVAEDPRLAGKIVMKEGPRNARGADKTLIITNTETGESVRYMVGVKEKNAPKTYGPVHGAEEADASRIEDAKSVRVTVWVMGNGDRNSVISARVSKYTELESYKISSVEKGAYNMGLVLADIEPIETEDGPYLFDVIFKDSRESAEPEVPSEKAERLSKRDMLEKEMDALFADFKGTPEAWRAVDAQYKKMTAELPQGRISALDHYRGSEAAAQAGRIDEAIALLQVAEKYGTPVDSKRGEKDERNYDPQDALRNIDALTSHYGEIDVIESIYRYFTYTPSLGEDILYKQAALDHFREELQQNGRFKGRVPLGTYEIGNKIYTVTAEGTTVQEKGAATPAPSPEVVIATPEVTLDRQAAADALQLSTRFSPDDVRRASDALRRVSTEELRYTLSQFQDGEFAYLKVVNSQMPEDSADGSISWRVQFQTVEGDSFTVSAEAKVDTAAVDQYIAASKVAGLEYNRGELIKYLALRSVVVQFNENLRASRENKDLNDKYVAYVKKEHITDTDQEKLQRAADKLELSTRLTPQDISMESLRYSNNRGELASMAKSMFPDEGSKPFLKEVYHRVNEINPDGSGLWHIEYEVEGQDPVILRVETGAIDAKAVADYVAAQEALGVHYDAATLTRYLGYVQLYQAFEEAWRQEQGRLLRPYATYRAAALAEARAARAAAAPAPAPKSVPGSFGAEIEAAMNEDPPVPPVSPEVTPELKLKEGEYKRVDPFVGLDEPYTGLVEMNWLDGTFFKGELKDSVPNGVGILDLGGEGETLGPVEFKDGNATVTLPDGKVKEIHWDTETDTFRLLDQ